MERYAQFGAHLLRACVRGILPVPGEVAQFEQFLFVPFERVTAGHEGVVVLTELPERDQYLAVVDDLVDLVPYGQDLVLRMAVHQVPVLQDDGGSLQGIAGCDDARLPGSFDLDLGAEGHELIHDVHAPGVERKGCKSCRPGPAVPESESPDTARMSEYRTTGDYVLEVLELGFDLLLLLLAVVGSLVHGLVGIQELADEVPALHAELVHVLLQFGGLLTHTFGYDQDRSSPDPVGLDTGEVPETGDLHLLRPLSVDTDRAVPDNQVYLVRCGRVLEVLALLV